MQYVERIREGEKEVMTKADIALLGVTSGTSGSKKYLPVYALAARVLCGVFWGEKGVGVVTSAVVG